MQLKYQCRQPTARYLYQRLCAHRSSHHLGRISRVFGWLDLVLRRNFLEFFLWSKFLKVLLDYALQRPGLARIQDFLCLENMRGNSIQSSLPALVWFHQVFLTS